MCDVELRPRCGRGGRFCLLSGIARSGLGRLRRLAVFDPAFVAQITTFLRFTLAFGRLAVFVVSSLTNPAPSLISPFTLMFLFDVRHDHRVRKTNAPRAKFAPRGLQFNVVRPCGTILR